MQVVNANGAGQTEAGIGVPWFCGWVCGVQCRMLCKSSYRLAATVAAIVFVGYFFG